MFALNTKIVIIIYPKEGIKLGIEEGKKEGIKEGIRETAKKLLKSNVGISIISSATGLSLEEIEKLK